MITDEEVPQQIEMLLVALPNPAFGPKRPNSGSFPNERGGEDGGALATDVLSGLLVTDHVVPGVMGIRQQCLNRSIAPDAVISARPDTVFHQVLFDLLDRHAFTIAPVDVLHPLCLIRIGDELLFLDLVAIGWGTAHPITLLKTAELPVAAAFCSQRIIVGADFAENAQQKFIRGT